MLGDLFLDGVSLRAFVAERGLDGPLVDVGSGAGFPGMVLAVLEPRREVTLVEATGKKARFLETVRAELGLERVNVRLGRSEDLAHLPELRSRFGLATARALAALPALLELTLPFLEVGGSLVAVKGAGVDSEVEASTRALDLLGASLVQVTEAPGRPRTRLVHVRLQRPVGGLYPRRAGVPASRPL
jgi:16S rRNA (guanine527-N7)-methyltransferase